MPNSAKIKAGTDKIYSVKAHGMLAATTLCALLTACGGGGSSSGGDGAAVVREAVAAVGLAALRLLTR